MVRILCFILSLFLFGLNRSNAQAAKDTSKIESSKVLGYHIGVVQIAFGMNNGKTTFLDKLDFYSLGFPVGITLKTPGKLKFDLEFVPVLKPYINSSTPYSVHLLFHPGVLYPLDHGWTLGFRLAFETGEGQIGFTPLINKGFKLDNGSVFFIELVAPARFGPNKNSGYTQLVGLHLGYGF
jgi:hypothetical protein